MSLSAHEMLIFLRARDEASRILNRFSGTVKNLNSTVLAENSKYIASTHTELNKQKELLASTKQATVAKVAAIKSEIANRRQLISEISRSSAIQSAAGVRQVSQYKVEIAELERLMLTTKAKSAASVAGIQSEIRTLQQYELIAKANHASELSRLRTAANERQASINKLHNLGLSLTSIGAGVAALGIGTVYALNSAAKSVTEYYQSAMTTFTQVDDQFKTTFDDIVNMGRESANKFAVPLDDMQGALYDIYSSMEIVGKDGSKMLDAASKAAVGGSTDVKTAASALIGLLNSYSLGANKVNDVNDVMFQLVRKGVGNFKDFTSAMATAGPSAKRAGQSYRESAAMLALMTRAGLSSARAGTSAARAFDAISNPKTAENMKKMGINIYDASGKLKPMIEIVRMMKKELNGLTDKEKLSRLKDMFAGSGGTIQARRFFDTALKDTSGLYETLYDDMKNASNAVDENGKKVGAAQQAYDKMSKTDMSRIIIAQNKMQIMWQKIGEAFMPVRTAIFEFGGRIADWFNNLDPQMQKTIVNVAAVVGGILILIGVVGTLTGVVIMFTAAAAAMDIALGPVILVILAIVAAIALLAGASYLIITNWQAISDFFKPFIDGLIKGWNDFVANFQAGWKQIQPLIDVLGKQFAETWDGLKAKVQEAWNKIQESWNSAKPLIDEIGKSFSGLSTELGPFFTALGKFAALIIFVVVQVILQYFNMMVGIIKFSIDMVVAIFSGALPGILQAVNGIINVITGLMKVFEGLVNFDFAKIQEGLGQAFSGVNDVIIGTVRGVAGGVIGAFSAIPGAIKDFFQTAFNAAYNEITNFGNNTQSALSEFYNTYIAPALNGLWESLQTVIATNLSILIAIFSGRFDLIPGYLQGAFAKITEFLTVGFQPLIDAINIGVANMVIAFANGAAGFAIVGITKFVEFNNSVINNLNSLISWIGGLGARITGSLGKIDLFQTGKDIINGLIRGFVEAWQKGQDFINGLNTWIKEHKGPMSYDKVMLRPNGLAIMKSFNDAMKLGMNDTKSMVNSFNRSLSTGINFGIDAQAVMPNTSMSSVSRDVNLTVHTNEIDPRKHAADLAWQLAGSI